MNEKIAKQLFYNKAWDDYLYWLDRDVNVLRRINELIKNTKSTPFSGLGKPELLKHDMRGYWSRRINKEHRMVYRVEGDTLYIVQLRYHY